MDESLFKMIVSAVLTTGVAAGVVFAVDARERRDWKSMLLLTLIVTSLAALAWLLMCGARLYARDLDGRYAQSELKPWFDGLKSGKGPCCSNADGVTVDEPDWESAGEHYRVRIGGEWVEVPDEALITEPNRAGRTMVWPTFQDGHPSVRCFMPGSMS